MNSILEYSNEESSLEIEDGSVVSQIDDMAEISLIEIFEESILTESSDPVCSVLESIEVQTYILESVEEVISILETSPPRGLKGDPGVNSGMIVEYPVAYPMSGHRMVVLNDNQQVIYASNLNPLHANKVLGMTIGAVISGDIGVQTGGPLEESSWDWILNVPIWLNDSGLMIQVPPTSGFSLIVGFPITFKEIFIDIREPIILA